MEARTAILVLAIALLPAGLRAQPAAAPSGAGLVDQISAGRLGLERIEDARQSLEAQRSALITQSETLAAAIQRRKSAQHAPGLLPDFDLQQKLRKSQELSDRLTLLNREIEALGQARKDRLQQLALAYDRMVDQTARQIQHAKGQGRQDLVSLMSKARQERDQIRNLLLPPQQQERSLATGDLSASDDPDELAEQVDAVRDEQDRLRRELARLDQRIGELDNERRLDRQMRDFITDQEIFDEGSRLLVVPRNSAAASDTAAPGQNGEPGRTEGPTDGASNDAGAGGLYDGASASPKADALPPATGNGSVAGRTPIGLQVETSDAPPEAGEDLRSIRQRRNAIARQLKALQVAQDRLQEKLDALSRE